jgi:hypothetical protein
MDIVQSVLPSSDDFSSEKKVKSFIKSYFNDLFDSGINFSYSGYFLFNKNHPTRWLEFDALLKLAPDIWLRESCVSNNNDPDVIMCKHVTDTILETIQEFYYSRDRTRLIIHFNEGLDNKIVKISITE